MLTRGVAALTDRERAHIMSAIARFSDFSEENDPWGEHDCAVLEVSGRRIIWKIDYYDPESSSVGVNALWFARNRRARRPTVDYTPNRRLSRFPRARNLSASRPRTQSNSIIHCVRSPVRPTFGFREPAGPAPYEPSAECRVRDQLLLRDQPLLRFAPRFAEPRI